jgi:ribonuclease BN (tRNA processing enzyme)
MRKPIVFSVLLAFLWGVQLLAQTKVVVLGTGTPVADPDRSGPAAAIVVKDSAYLVDAGPGVVRRAAAAERNGIAQLHPQNIKIVFFTHLHSDHTLGYPDLIFSPWVLDRTDPLTSYGPKGLRDMTNNIEKAWSKDIDVRINGLEKANATGYKVNVHEISPGIVYQDANVKVTAFAVKHGSWDQSFGYRFDTADRSIVLSGDTAPTDSVVKACTGCDVLLHEVYDPQRGEVSDPHWGAYFKAFHTNSEELAGIAMRAKPKLLVLYHQLYGAGGDDALIEQVKKHYVGQVVSAKDLGVY